MFPFETVILLDKTLKTPIYKQIAFAIMEAIRKGALKSGAHLPGTRALAKKLSVHRKTVIAAYDELQSQDWIVITPRKYTCVSKQIPGLQAQKWNDTAVSTPYEKDFELPIRTVERGLKRNNLIPEYVIDDGHPDVRLSPIDDLLKTYRSYTSRKYAIKSAHIGTDQGTLRLRQALSLYLSETRGLNSSVENILITQGAQMSIYLAAQLLLTNASSIVVGKPNYPAANRTFEENGAKLIEVDVDEEGLDTKAIEVICKTQNISAVYVIPHHHYPTTVTLSVSRRMELLALSQQYSFAIIEDDYDYDYHYTSSPYLPLASADHNGNVIYIGSFSKMLDPSLRIGFMVAPENFIMQAVALRRLIDVGGDGYMQNALANLIENGELKRHLKKAKKIYHDRRDFLEGLLKKELKECVFYTVPSGGMTFWIQLFSKYSVSYLQQIPQLKILRVDVEKNGFRLGFASRNEDELIEIVAVLKRFIEESADSDRITTQCLRGGK